MSFNNGNSLVLPAQFIQAIRDAGYKSLGSAVAELIDNAFEACASKACVSFHFFSGSKCPEFQVVVADDGSGMDPDTLEHSLQFGWSSRFNRRDSVGRYGMGLPNASLSHARRVEVWSSTDGKTAFRTHLDVDEVVGGEGAIIVPARKADYADFRNWCPFAKGTVVIWSKCDRLKAHRTETALRKLRTELGRLFRHQLWSGKTLLLNGDQIVPYDPLFLREGANLCGANPFGSESSYELEVPDTNGRTSSVNVKFTELPVEAWHSLSNEEKNSEGIAKRAGVSIVRAGREIDSGWFFMGQKRRENYDDWWRCEVRFEPQLDELFGVTHTKQEIHPTEHLSSILTPDIERTARELNGRARKAFMAVKATSHIERESERVAGRFDSLIEPPPQTTRVKRASSLRRGGRGRVGGLEYRLEIRKLDQLDFFISTFQGARLTVVLNEQHPFVKQAFATALAKSTKTSTATQRNLELIIFAAARAELLLKDGTQTRNWTQQFRTSWSNILATFLS